MHAAYRARPWGTITRNVCWASREPARIKEHADSFPVHPVIKGVIIVFNFYAVQAKKKLPGLSGLGSILAFPKPWQSSPMEDEPCGLLFHRTMEHQKQSAHPPTICSYVGPVRSTDRPVITLQLI